MRVTGNRRGEWSRMLDNREIHNSKFTILMKTSLGVTHENISRYLFAHAFCCNAVGFLLISRYLETGPQGKIER
jgi:hypothetical protein